MSSSAALKTVSEGRISEPKSVDIEVSGQQLLDTVEEVNENVASEIFERPYEARNIVEIPARIFGLKEVLEPLTIPSLINAIYELGVVNMCWPEITEPVFETRTCFPPSYYTNSTKERLLLAYAENFRRQYNFHFQMRKPLLLQVPNECGLQKMVCTSIRPTKLSFTDTSTWQGVASLVSDYFDYEPLTKPILHPERLISPYTAIVRRSANPFELAHVLVSWLIGAGYDAYVVVGCATRDVCMAIRYRTICPEIPDDKEEVEEPPPPEEEPRYKLVPLPDLTSKYCKDRELQEAAKVQGELDKIENERKKKIAELEKPPPDEMDGWRTHAWVLILPGFMGVEEPFFIEPSEGNGYPLSTEHYQHIESVYNNDNYYANIQKESEEGLGALDYDLSNLSCWEHLLAGEPFYRRQLVGIDTSDKRSAPDTEKHLDMPFSWVEKLDITADDYEQRYPGSHKVIHYKKVLLEKFSPYSQRDGIVKRIKIFDDYALSVPLITYEWYKHREDMMMFVKIDHVENQIKEKFGIGRKDHLLKHIYAMDSPSSVEGDRVLKFNYYARLDHLTKLVCTPVTFEEHYTDRDDRLESRVIVYTPGTKAEPKRQVKDITETYSRNHDVPAKKDIWKKIFHIQDNTIELLYQYAYNFVTNDTRSFIKPNLAETGGKILFYPDKTSGYIADPVAEQPRPLDLYYALCDNIDWEYNTNKHIRDRETDVNSYLRQRQRELKEPELCVALFDTERNEAAKKGWRDQEIQRAEVTEREKEAEIDPLAPYLARMFGSGHGTGSPVSVKEATLVREQCINDFKAKQLARQNLVQERFDKFNAEYKTKRLWYLANQFILTPEKESAYFAASAELSFKVHALEVRLTRHRDLSGPRFKVLIDYLDKHPLLKEYNKAAHQHKQDKDRARAFPFS